MKTLLLQIETITIVEQLMIELASNCKKVASPIVGKSWELSDCAREAINTILNLNCVDGSHSAHSIANAVNDYALDFDSTISLV